MHAAVVNRLHNNFNITKPLLAPIVLNQQSCSLVGNGQLLEPSTARARAGCRSVLWWNFLDRYVPFSLEPRVLGPT